MKRIVFLCLLILGSFIVAKGGEPNKGYRGFVDIALGDAYNFNSDQKVSTNNMQLYCMVSTTHGYVLKNWFVGAGVGYYHSRRDKENMYPVYAAGRYSFEKVKLKPFIEVRAGIIYDPLWVEEVQKYGALSMGANVIKCLQVGLRGSIFSRPGRLFTANAALVVTYIIGK